MGKRGTDHIWELIKYRGDMAIYAKCLCGFRYNCSHNKINADGQLVVEADTYCPYCPHCGARKKWHTDDIQKIDKYSFE